MRTFICVCWTVILFSTTLLAADPLADEINRWKQFVETNEFTSEEWKSVREGAQPLIERAAKALADGRRNAAVHYLAAVRSNLAGAKFVQDHHVNAETKLESLEKEWIESGSLHTPTPLRLEDVPASMRAVAEASFSEVKVYYEASVEYGRNTTPEYGYFYLGLSRAQLDFANLLGTIRQKGAAKAPAFPSLSNQIDQVEDELLAAYKPPASIDHHPTFIRASAMIKQARELETTGLKFGALYRLLQARQLLAKVTDPDITITPDEINIRAAEMGKKLGAEKADHSIARIFVERAAVEPEDAQTAASIFQKVLPVYFAAMQPAAASKPSPTPAATVTFVRWPYT